MDGGADVNQADGMGCTPLLLMAQEGHLDIVKYLVEKGADIDHRISTGPTALYFAAYKGRFDVVKFLVLKGADMMAVGGHCLLLKRT